MSQFKTRSARNEYIRQQKAKKVKRIMPVVGTALAVTPAVMGLNTVKASAAETGQAQNQSAFIEQLGASAMQVSSSNDLYASIMVAQALVETGFGSSTLSAAPYYNLFGVKEYNGGPSIYMNTQEFLDGQWVSMSEPFAVYNSYEESFLDHANIMRNSYYAGAWKSHTSSYQDAAVYLTGRYATDPGYAGKLISLIQMYNLTRFDTPGAGTVIEAAPTAAVVEQTQEQAAQPEAQAATPQATGQTYTVQNGDSLWGIAQHFGVTVDQLLANNGLSLDSMIMPGQQLAI